MISVFLYAFNSIMPMFVLMILGYFLKRIGLFNDGFLKTANSFVFRVCLPVLLFYNIYNIDSLSDINWNVVWYSLAISVLLFILGYVLARFFVKDPAQKGVLLQCTYRSNFAIVGISLTQLIGGTQGVATAAVISAFTIPAYNILAVLSLTIFIKHGANDKIIIRETLKKIVTNPLIIGVFVGIVFLLLRQIVPVNTEGKLCVSLKDTTPFLYVAIKNVASMASPLALVVLGGQFCFSAVRGMLPQIIAGTSLRLVVAPVIGLGIAIFCTERLGLFGFGPTEYSAFVSLFATPVAVSSAIMAGEMDNDEQYAGQLVVWTSLLSMGTIFLAVVVLRTFGLL
jgi:predicted permease